MGINSLKFPKFSKHLGNFSELILLTPWGFLWVVRAFRLIYTSLYKNTQFLFSISGSVFSLWWHFLNQTIRRNGCVYSFRKNNTVGLGSIEEKRLKAMTAFFSLYLSFPKKAFIHLWCPHEKKKVKASYHICSVIFYTHLYTKVFPLCCVYVDSSQKIRSFIWPLNICFGNFFFVLPLNFVW